MSEDRPPDNFVTCVCGVIYISGYTHCPKCGVINPSDKELNDALPLEAIVKSIKISEMEK